MGTEDIRTMKWLVERNEMGIERQLKGVVECDSERLMNQLSTKTDDWNLPIFTTQTLLRCLILSFQGWHYWTQNWKETCVTSAPNAVDVDSSPLLYEANFSPWSPCITLVIQDLELESLEGLGESLELMQSEYRARVWSGQAGQWHEWSSRTRMWGWTHLMFPGLEVAIALPWSLR